MKNLLQTNIEASIAQLRALKALEAPLLEAAQMVERCLRDGHKLLLCGNGGSAADAAHIATEFVCRYQRDRRAYPAICLSDSGSTLTATGNDYDFKTIFARQVEAFGRDGDVLIALSTSGRSPNVVAALEQARRQQLASIALLGHDGGAARGLASLDLVVPGCVTARIQEAHKLLLHTLCEMVEQTLAE